MYANRVTRVNRIAGGSNPTDNCEGEQMLHFNSCPKCEKGTVEHSSDIHGDYLQCLNCGFMRDIRSGANGEQVAQYLMYLKRKTATKDPVAA